MDKTLILIVGAQKTSARGADNDDGLAYWANVVQGMHSCPFCGDNQHLYVCKQHEEDGGKWFCDCQNCGAQPYQAKTKDDALRLWNRRDGCPPSPPPSTSGTNEPPRDGVGG